jgi:2-hydroxy fatty acid dioxygenase
VIPLPSYLTIPSLPLDLGTLGTIGYCAFYILLEPIAGTLIAPALIASTAYWHHLLSIAPSPTNQIAIGVFIVSWIAQFIGHGAFEGRAPALLDNLVQALVLAPFFVWMELLFMLGYRPELKGRVDKEVEKEIEKFRRSKANGAAKNGAAK